MTSHAWTYTFCDLLTGAELATLPMAGVTFDTQLCGVGALTGLVPTVDPKVRALNPWAATEPRRTVVYVEHDGQVMWGGIVWGRRRSQGVPGLTLTAATFESWLAYAYLRSDLFIEANTTAEQAIAYLLQVLQSYPNANVRLTPQLESAEFSGFVRRNFWTWQRNDLKSGLELVARWRDDPQDPVEFGVQVTRGGSGYEQTLLLGEPRLGRALQDSELHLAYPKGGLLTWADVEDGTTHPTGVYGIAEGESDVKLWGQTTAPDLGSDEFQAGFPLTVQTYSTGGTKIEQTVLDERVKARLLSRLNSGRALEGVTVRPDNPALGSYGVGDEVTVEVTHPSYQEWPKKTTFPLHRITKKKVTVQQGGGAEVALDLTPAGELLPPSITLTAQLQEMLRRLRDLEVA